MNEATALAEAQHSGALHRRGKARHTHHRLLRREVDDLKPIQPFERLAGYSPLHTDTRCEVRQIDVDAARVFLDYPTESAGQQRRRRPKVL